MLETFQSLIFILPHFNVYILLSKEGKKKQTTIKQSYQWHHIQY